MILTVETSLAFLLSVTVSPNTNTVFLEISDGAVNDAVAVLALSNVTDGPPNCFQEYDCMVPSGSLLLVPSKLTVSPALTARSEPGLLLVVD